MFKRLRWMGMGAVAGIGASAWAQRRVHQTLQQHPSILAGADVVSAARRVGQEVKGAVADGRRAMAEREAALRAAMDRGQDTPTPDGVRRRLAPAPGARGGDGRARLHVVDATAHEARPPSGRAVSGPRWRRSGALTPHAVGGATGAVSGPPGAPAEPDGLLLVPRPIGGPSPGTRPAAPFPVAPPPGVADSPEPARVASGPRPRASRRRGR